MSNLQVVVCGAQGKMGREAVRSVYHDPDTQLVGAVDVTGEGEDIGEACLGHPIGILIINNLEDALSTTGPQVLVDFTSPAAVKDNIFQALSNGVIPVVGTTGLSAEDFRDIEEWTREYQRGAIIVPNFAVGAVLMMKFARMAARFFSHAEVVELHHDGKLDAPSGTALKTAEQIRETWESTQEEEEAELEEEEAPDPEEAKKAEEKVEGARGGIHQGVHVHSVRLPGLVAHQEVILGGSGQTLTIKHDSLDRSSFMPGLLLAIKKAPEVQGLVYGLEHLMELE